MTEQELLKKMVSPGQRRPGKWAGGVIQILVTHSCDKACFGCTQGSNLHAPRWGGSPWQMSVDQFREACRSLKDYFGVVGVFGGNPAMHRQFPELCEVMRSEVPYERRGLWCNNPITLDNARTMRETFNPAVSNLNVHMDSRAYDLFREGWPEARPFGLNSDSRHSPPWVAMKDLESLPVFDKNHALVGETANTPENRHGLISQCDINRHWSAMIGVFRGELRAWFCEIAGAQAIHHQNDPDYPDTGVPLHLAPGESLNGEDKGCPIEIPWWTHTMASFRNQVRRHCHECGVPLRGHGELALNDAAGKEQTSQTHARVFVPKRGSRAVELVTRYDQMGSPLTRTTDYVGNAKR